MTTNNIFTEYLEYATEQTDAPIEFLSFAFLSCIGAMIGQKRYIKFGANGIAPNFWTVLLAPSGNVRKSTAIRIATRLIRKVAPELIIPEEFSHEKLLELLEVQPQAMMVFDEFLSLTGLLERDFMANTKSVITHLWDEYESYERKTLAKTITILNPCLSILSATTAVWFRERIKENDLLGGFLPRFLFIISPPKLLTKPWPDAPDIIKENWLKEKLLKIKSLEQSSMGADEEALKLYNDWYINFSNRLGENPYDVFFNRLNIYCLKIAITLETGKSLGESLIISKATMKEAIASVEWVYKQIKNFVERELSFTRTEAFQKKMLSFMVKINRPVTISELHRHFAWTTRQMRETLEALMLSGQIIKRYNNTYKGRPKEEWVAKEVLENKPPEPMERSESDKSTI